jgi:hypothetical protein
MFRWCPVTVHDLGEPKFETVAQVSGSGWYCPASSPQTETKEESVLLTKRRFLDFGRCAGDGCRR